MKYLILLLFLTGCVQLNKLKTPLPLYDIRGKNIHEIAEVDYRFVC